MKKYDFSFYLANFLEVFLPGQKGLSTNTILSYRDTFVLFLRYCQDIRGIKLEKLTFDYITRNLIADFLSWLETDKKSSISTRNQRLAAIRSFFRYVQIEAPERLLLCQSIVSIEIKKQPKPLVKYLTYDGIKILLGQPVPSTSEGWRDLALLSILYDSGARVQELCDIKIGDIRLSAPATVQLTGKGNKTRCVPLSSGNVAILKKYLSENGLNPDSNKHNYLFMNKMHKPLTRSGVRYILDKYVKQARDIAPEHIPDTVTLHCLRHSKAMHLLQSGTNLIYIRDFLGHDDIKTTQVYAKADPEMKRKALVDGFGDGKIPNVSSWKNDSDLLKRLTKLGR